MLDGGFVFRYTVQTQFHHALFRHSHDDRGLHLGIIPMHFDNLQASLIDQSLPFGLGAFHGAEEGHHEDIHISRLPRHAGVREHDFIDDDARMRAQGGNRGLQDLDTLRFGPVVQHVAEVVELGVLDRLRLEEIVHVQFDAWDGLCAFQGGWDLLNDHATGEVGELVSESDGLLAESAADVDQNCLFRAGGEGAHFFFNGEGFGPIVTALQGHEVSEARHVVLVLGHPLKGAKVGVECFLKDGVISGSDVLVLFLFDETCQGLHDEAKIVISIDSVSCAPTAPSHFTRTYT